jgi:hypothetical protein
MLLSTKNLFCQKRSFYIVPHVSREKVKFENITPHLRTALRSAKLLLARYIYLYTSRGGN